MSVRVRVIVQPRSSQQKVELLTGDPNCLSLKVWVHSPPSDGAANEEVVQLLADCLKIAKSKISIQSGHQSRRKAIQIDELDEDALKRKLNLTQ